MSTAESDLRDKGFTDVTVNGPQATDVKDGVKHYFHIVQAVNGYAVSRSGRSHWTQTTKKLISTTGTELPLRRSAPDRWCKHSPMSSGAT